MQNASQADDVRLADLLLIACFRLRDLEACKNIEKTLQSRAGTDPEAQRALAQHRLRIGDEDAAIATMKTAVEVAPELQQPRYRLVLAQMLYEFRRFAEAADEYERVLVGVDESPDTLRYAGALYNCGRLAKALQLARAVRGARTAVPDFSEIEALVMEDCGGLAEANNLRQALLDAEVSPARQRLKIAANLARMNRKSEAVPLITTVSIEEVAAEPELLSASARLRTILELPDALVYARRLLLVQFNNPQAHLCYIGIFINRETIDESILRPKTVAAHCTVTLRHGAETLTYTLAGAEGDANSNRLSSSHPLAILLMGKSVGDKFRFPENSLAADEYEILLVQSEYIFAFQDCLKHFSQRFPTDAGLTKVNVEIDDPTNIARVLDGWRAKSERVLELYNGGSLPACMAARLLGRSDVELFHILVVDYQTRVLSSRGRGRDLNQELSGLSTTSEVLVETSALVTLEWLGLLPKLSERFTCVQVTQHTIDSIRESALNMHPEKETGSMFADGMGRIRIAETNAGGVRAQQQFFERIAKFLHLSAVVIAPTSTRALGEFEREDLRDTLGWAAASTIAAASASGVLVYSDDRCLREVARNGQLVRSFWTQTLLQDLLQKDHISADEYHTALARLIEARFHFVSVRDIDLIREIRLAGWKPIHRVVRMVGQLAGPDCSVGDAVNITIHVLHEIWTDAISLGAKLVMLDLFINVLVTGRNAMAVLQSLRRINATRLLIWTPATSEIQRGIDGWVTARTPGLVPGLTPEILRKIRSQAP